MTNGVSIIIPTYDTPEYLDECVNSIKKQKIDFEVEILIGIDGCENTLDYVKEHNQNFKDTNIFYFKKNVGPFIIKNNLINETKYEYILFFDSDDIMNRNMLKSFYDSISNYDIVNFNFCDFRTDIRNCVFFRQYAFGVFGIKKSVFNSFVGFQSWRCSADTEFKLRTDFSGVKRYVKNGISFFRRLHTKNLTVKSETNNKSEIRKGYKSIINDKMKSNKWENPEIILSEFEKIN